MKMKIAVSLAAFILALTPAPLRAAPGPREQPEQAKGGNPNNGNNGNDKENGNAQGEKKPKGPGHNE